MAVKPPALLHKMSVTHQKAWYKKNDPENMPAHLSTSVAKSKSATPDKARVKAREKLSLKAYGATKGLATGGEGGNSEAPPKDTVAPLTRDQHSAVQSAKRTSEPPKAAKAEKPKTAPAAKPVDRLALIRAAAKKSQSAAGKMKRAAKFDVPTEDPDDNTHDDYVSQHYGMHHYKEEVESVDESNHDWVHDLVARAKARNPNANIKVTTGAEKKKETEEMLKKRAAERAKNPKKAVYTRSPGSEKYDLHGVGKDPISGRSYNEEVEQIEEGKMKASLPDSGDKSDDDYEATIQHVVRQAKGIAFGKRYKSGNMTGAHVAISKLGKKYGIGNLENHPEVKAMLQKANEQYETDAIRMTKAIAAARPETNAGPKDISSPEKKRTMSHDKLSSIATAAKRKLMSTDPLNPNKQMGEEVEQVEEATMKDDYKSYSVKGNDKPGWMLRADPQLAAKFKEKAKAAALRKKYMGKTSDEIAAMKKEEVEHIEERLSKNDPPSKWIHDFVASDNPKFAGKSKKERIDMALGAYYGKKRGV